MSQEKSSIATIELSGTAETELAVETHHGYNQKAEIILQPQWRASFRDGSSLTAILRLRADAQDTLEPGEPDDNARSPLSRRYFVGDHAETELRELFVDLQWDNLYWRLGKQQIVWGQADGLKVLDVVNPQSFREFILDEFDDSRIPLWSVNLEIPIGDSSQLQWVWIPDTTYHDLPERDATFAFRSSRLIPQAPEGVAVTLKDANRPGNPWSDADGGLRFSSFYRGWDISLNYLYHYRDEAVLYRRVTPSGVFIEPEYERSHLLGGTLSNAFGNVTLRSEFGYSSDIYLVSQDAADTDGIEQAAEFSYVFGLDYSGIDNTLLSAQFFQSLLQDEVQGVSRAPNEESLTFLAERSFLNETWKAKVQLIHSVDEKDGLVRPHLRYDYSSDIRLWVGADIFYGEADGLYGQFDKRDRIYVGAQWGFD